MKLTWQPKGETILITPREMRDLSLLSTVSVGFGSACTFFLSAAITCKLGGVFADTGHISPQGEVLAGYGAIACLIIAIIFGVLSGLTLLTRSKALNEIRKESVPVTATIRIQATAKTTGDQPGN